MYDMYPDWGPAQHNPENPRSNEAVQAAIDSASAQSPADKRIGVYGQNYRDWLVRRT